MLCLDYFNMWKDTNGSRLANDQTTPIFMCKAITISMTYNTLEDRSIQYLNGSNHKAMLYLQVQIHLLMWMHLIDKTGGKCMQGNESHNLKRIISFKMAHIHWMGICQGEWVSMCFNAYPVQLYVVYANLTWSTATAFDLFILPQPQLYSLCG